jgi:hypothetical protein
MIPWLDYNHTFTIEVTLGDAVVSTTRHNVGDIPSSARPVRLIITDGGGVSVGIPMLSTIAES